MEKVVVTRSSNTPRTYDRREGEWVVRNSNTPRTYDRRGGGVRAIVKHRGPMTGGQTCDRRGCLKKEDK